MTLVSRCTPDEPLADFLVVPEVKFFVTGGYRDADRRILATAPSIVTFTGFLPDARYVGQFIASDAVIY